MKILPSLCGIRVIREIRGQKNQPRITQISRKNHNESHFHPQWRAAGSWKLGGEFRLPASTTKTQRHQGIDPCPILSEEFVMIAVVRNESMHSSFVTRHFKRYATNERSDSPLRAGGSAIADTGTGRYRHVDGGRAAPLFRRI